MLNWYRKWKFERKHGPHSYGAAMFLAGIKQMVDENEAKRGPVLDEEPSPKLKWDDGWDDDEEGISC